MVNTRLSNAGGVCPLGRTHESSCSECCSGSAMFQKPLPPCQRAAALHLLDLPIELMERILLFLTYKEISHARSVCQKFNSIAANLLTKSFYVLQNQTSQLLQSVKSQMPRRESLRRKHPLASQCDIIETINMRFNLLQMTFGKHVERKFICFFAGEILDEVVRVTLLARTQICPPERMTDELCDLSTMAMEYFREHLDTRLRSSLLFARGADALCTNSPGPGSTCTSSVVGSSVGGCDTADNDLNDWDDQDLLESPHLAVLNKKIAKLTKSMKRNTTQIVQLRREIRGHRQRSQEQSRLIAEYAARIDEHDKKLDEASIKFSSLLQDLSECRRELLRRRRSCPLGTAVCPCDAPGPSGCPAAIDGGSDVSTDTEGDKVSTRSKRKLSHPDDGARRHRSVKTRRRAKN